MSHAAERPADDPNLPGLFAVAHALLLILFLSWRFGGMEPFSRLIGGCGCLAAPLISVLAWRQAEAALRRKFLQIVLPLAGIALLVGISALNPHMRMLTEGDAPAALMPREDFIRVLPSTAWPAEMLPDFLLNAGLVLIGLNLFLARPTRAQQRALLGVVAVNAAVLAAVGSAFKLGHARAILGVFPSPNENFFATFVYYNHWGGFALLGAAAAAALALHFRDRAPSGEWTQTPAPLLGVLALIIFVSLALSAARGSLAAGLLLAFVFAARLVPGASGSRERRRLRLVAILAVFAVLAGTTLWVARDRLQLLWRKTSTQVTDARTGGMGDARLQLYRETWQLFLQRPVFGWGWHSYRYAFRRVQQFDFRMQNEQKVRTVVLDAHNDWLQLLTELGLVGAALAAATLIGVARAAPWKRWRLSPSYELAAGAAAVGLLACIDFPFACPAIVVTWWTLLATAAAIAHDRGRSPSAA